MRLDWCCAGQQNWAITSLCPWAAHGLRCSAGGRNPALLYLVAVVIALVGAIGLFNALAMSVLERRREIGILRSMGASAGRVAQVFWTEGLSLGTLAWAVALVLGIPAAYLFVQLLGSLFLPVPFAWSPLSLLLMLLFMLVVASLASLVPVIVASQVKIADTLRYE